ncbi:MAG: hypothetical protein HYX41_06185 [Bdellovibrio sp.]|nr:hypothetical protein [Bdellovibrio sp.]
MRKTQNRLWAGLGVLFFIGTLLRVLYVQDMEYKEDEEYNFTQTQLIGNSQPWPWYGIPSGVYLVNPGMSIWVFAVLAKLFGIHSPTSLAHAVQAFALLGIAMILPFAFRFVQDSKERQVWLWAFALSLVNPFLILYQRKLWPEPFLPFFVMLTFMGWWRRERWGYALLWGAVGACLGQIHMSGFFFAAGLFLWTLAFDPRPKKTCWKAWTAGSILGALPLVPWAYTVLTHPVEGRISAGLDEITQLKYWTFWITDPTGLTLGNPLGLLRGSSNWAQISDFVRYPLVSGHASYVVGIFHAVALISSILIYIFAVRRMVTWNPRKWAQILIGRDSNSVFLQNSALIACGILMTLTGVVIRRYYMTITFPLEFIFLIHLARPDTTTGKRLLGALWIAELVISMGFVHYIHQNQGSIQGDYGEAYHLKVK